MHTVLESLTIAADVFAILSEGSLCLKEIHVALAIGYQTIAMDMHSVLVDLDNN